MKNQNLVLKKVLNFREVRMQPDGRLQDGRELSETAGLERIFSPGHTSLLLSVTEEA